MDWRDIQAFYKTLCQITIMTNLALRLLVLTAIRTNPLRHIHENQIDGDIWMIPAENMKGRRDTTTESHMHLSSEAFTNRLFVTSLVKYVFKQGVFQIK